jgi:DNA-binding Lrp family transcriptional regulator
MDAQPGLLDDQQAAALAADRVTSGFGHQRRPDGVQLEPDDAALVMELGRDGRASVRRLAERTGWSASRVTRRLAALVEGGAMYFDVDLDLTALGFTAVTHLWLTVAPRHLDEVGEALIRHEEVAYCAAVTGSANLTMALVCSDPADLYRYLTSRLGTIDAIQRVETSPLVRRVKQAGTVLTEAGLTPTSLLAGIAVPGAERSNPLARERQAGRPGGQMGRHDSPSRR